MKTKAMTKHCFIFLLLLVFMINIWEININLTLDMFTLIWEIHIKRKMNLIVLLNFTRKV